jgi:hypothetical protein
MMAICVIALLGSGEDVTNATCAAGHEVSTLARFADLGSMAVRLWPWLGAASYAIDYPPGCTMSVPWARAWAQASLLPSHRAFGR